MRLQLSDPTPTFINMMLRKKQSNQIVSLRLKRQLFWDTSQLVSLMGFTKLTSLTLFDLRPSNYSHSYEQYLPNLNRLFLYFDHGLDFFILTNFLKRLQQAIRRLEIHCNGAICTHSPMAILFDRIFSKLYDRIFGDRYRSFSCFITERMFWKSSIMFSDEYS